MKVDCKIAASAAQERLKEGQELLQFGYLSKVRLRGMGPRAVGLVEMCQASSLLNSVELLEQARADVRVYFHRLDKMAPGEEVQPSAAVQGDSRMKFLAWADCVEQHFRLIMEAGEAREFEKNKALWSVLDPQFSSNEVLLEALRKTLKVAVEYISDS